MANKEKKGSPMFADKNFTARNSAKSDNHLLGVHSQIAQRLRAFYTIIEEEEIPSHLLNLLEKLDKAEKNNKAGKLRKAEEHSFKAGKHG